MPLTTRKLGNSTDSYTNGNSSNSPLKKPSKYSYSRQNSTRSRRNSRSQSPKSRNGSADSNASKKSEYIRTNSPRYGKGWGFGKDSAKSTRSTRSRFGSKNRRKNVNRSDSNDSDKSKTDSNDSGKSI